MDKKVLRFIVFMIPVFAMIGCGNYSKLIKSKDHNQMYQQALAYYNAKKYQKTIQLFEEVAPVFGGTAKEDTIQFYTAASFYNTGDFESSGMLLDNFRRGTGRTSPFLEEAEYMYAMGFYYSSPQPERDQSNTVKAMIAISEYLDRYPNSPKKDALNDRTKELQGKMYDKEYLNAKCYYTISKYKSAVMALKNALNASPENPHREEMMYLVAKSGYLLAHRSMPELQHDRYLKMMDYYLNFISEYPDSKYAKELGKMMEDARKYIADKQTDNKDKTATENGI